jgi:hypothetical protein
MQIKYIGLFWYYACVILVAWWPSKGIVGDVLLEFCLFARRVSGLLLCPIEPVCSSLAPDILYNLYLFYSFLFYLNESSAIGPSRNCRSI